MIPELAETDDLVRWMMMECDPKVSNHLNSTFIKPGSCQSDEWILPQLTCTKIGLSNVSVII